MADDLRMLASSPRTPDLEALARWGRRVGLEARDALRVADKLRHLVDDRERRTATIATFFGSDDPSHSFHVEPHHWLNLTEAQATSGLAAFVRQGGTDRISAFLRSIEPTFAWPRSFTTGSVKAEAKAARGRIDLLVLATENKRTWGAIIQAKFGHTIKSNPLSSYAKTGVSAGLTFKHGEAEQPTGVLVVLGQRNCPRTR